MNRLTYAIILAIAALCGGVSASDKQAAAVQPLSSPERIVYKTVRVEKGEFALKLHIFNPEQSTNASSPCIVIFHGGGWNNGEPATCYSAARRWASLGLAAIAVEYRIRDLHGGNALDSVRDAKSAMRWIRSHAAGLKIDPDRIAAQGSSAGGHLAAACATLTAFDEEGEDKTVSCVPNALLLRSPVLDNGPGGYGQYKKEVSENWKAFSPFHNIRKGVPPAIVSVGTDEAKHLRVEVARELKKKMEEAGSRCELFVLDGATHTKRTAEQNEMVNREQEKFLKSLGYISASE
jgi:acetyl esterase